VDHQIKRVGMGARVTLTYLLRRNSKIEPSPTVVDEEPARVPLAKDRWQHLHQIIDGNRCDCTHQTGRLWPALHIVLHLDDRVVRSCVQNLRS
jgi:hypothetical protein